MGLRVLQEMHGLGPDRLTGAITICDTSDSRSVYSQFNSWATSVSIPVTTIKNPEDLEREVRRLQPDIVFVAGWYWLINEPLLNAVPGGFLGFHYSLLPKYRGNAPLVWALINGEPEVGFSLFSMVPEMDAGAIWAQRRYAVTPDETVAELMARLQDGVVEVLRETYLKILNGRVTAVAQKDLSASYCALRIPEDGLIDWNWSASRIHNFVRAQTKPYPGAFTLWKGKKLTIWRTARTEGTVFASAGQVVGFQHDWVLVGCGGHDQIILKEIEYAGSTDSQPRKILGSLRIRLGA